MKSFNFEHLKSEKLKYVFKLKIALILQTKHGIWHQKHIVFNWLRSSVFVVFSHDNSLISDMIIGWKSFLGVLSLEVDAVLNRQPDETAFRAARWDTGFESLRAWSGLCWEAACLSRGVLICAWRWGFGGPWNCWYGCERGFISYQLNPAGSRLSELEIRTNGKSKNANNELVFSSKATL